MDEKTVDPIPTNFDSAETAGEFWDTHDTMDYPDAWQEIEVSARLRSRVYQVEFESDVAQALRERARQQGVSASDLATRLLREQLLVA